MAREDREQRPKTIGENPANPAVGNRLTLAVDGPAGKRSETIDLIHTLAGVLVTAGYDLSAGKDVVHLTDSGIALRPGLVSFAPRDDLSMQMCTSIEVRLPEADGLPFFEYQHSVGETGALAVRAGFESWVQVDLPVILAVAQEPLLDLSSIRFQEKDQPARRAILGPVAILAVPESGAGESTDATEHPDCCPCCLLTHSMTAYREQVMSGSLVAIRLYAAMLPDGPQADCRINGEDCEAGKVALAKYAASWPTDRIQTRKQYVIVHNHDLPSSEQKE